MAGKRKVRYSGALNKPIVRWGFRFVTAEPNDQRIMREWLAKVDLLLAHYDIRSEDPDRWRTLAFHLALDHVCGMQVIDRPRPRKGPSRKWDLPHTREFVELIEQIKRERRKGIKDAIRIAQRRKQLRGDVLGLETRYYDAKKRLSQHRTLTDLAEAWLRDAASKK